MVIQCLYSTTCKNHAPPHAYTQLHCRNKNDAVCRINFAEQPGICNQSSLTLILLRKTRDEGVARISPKRKQLHNSIRLTHQAEIHKLSI